MRSLGDLEVILSLFNVLHPEFITDYVQQLRIF